MSQRVNEINTVIKSIPDVKIVKLFEQSKIDIEGCITVFADGLEQPLEFNVTIHPQYPFKSHETETIKFSNDDLIEYKHIMQNGAICIHIAHTPVLSQKLIYDIESVKAWIKKYYINKDSDTHYEHLIVPQKAFKENHFAYFFNEVDYTFHKNQFGFVDYSIMNNGVFHKENIQSSIFQSFLDKDRKKIVDIDWNFQLKNLPQSTALFVFLKDAPSKNQRWVFNDWKDFETTLPQDFLKFLHNVEERLAKEKGKTLPLFVGYNISETEIHWQAIILEIGKFPIYGEKIDKQWLTKIEEDRFIHWAMTRNCSYKYFFGRGKLSERITESKILIIGVGAVGSILAKTLIRCGCRRLGFIEFDVKEPENVCRSEYSFFTGITNKTNDLINELFLISPFFEPINGGYDYSEAFDFFIKSHLADRDLKAEMEKHLEEYDIIIDCSADNDLLYVLSQLQIKSTLLNISISNHAKHLVCAAEQNRYDFIISQFAGNILEFDVDDLHNPTGCWSPTFKASYNDINVLVQTAIKQINLKFEQKKTLRNFVIDTDETNGFNINIKEF
ncbi:thiamine biosynthesis protein ThiF [Elizabethkingia argentiflava]|uniref:Thiamine biosynthesis protein ThiF n=1 Tax=Elizabethkingia argenteiflava TaxID=2681556 RepID=A0A845PYD7_9FLAO|nr:ThiF family adenylyltransferase [Elizabethkingia argenteiflava]NAW51836.1 thiamine biosynthesis protein ThiF [Elizabethkingia argenteiflava]